MIMMQYSSLLVKLFGDMNILNVAFCSTACILIKRSVVRSPALPLGFFCSGQLFHGVPMFRFSLSNRSVLSESTVRRGKLLAGQEKSLFRRGDYEEK